MNRLVLFIKRGDIHEPRVKARVSAKVTGMAAIENQEHICPRSIQIALDEVPSDMAELLSKA